MYGENSADIGKKVGILTLEIDVGMQCSRFVTFPAKTAILVLQSIMENCERLRFPAGPGIALFSWCRHLFLHILERSAEGELLFSLGTELIERSISIHKPPKRIVVNEKLSLAVSLSRFFSGDVVIRWKHRSAFLSPNLRDILPFLVGQSCTHT